MKRKFYPIVSGAFIQSLILLFFVQNALAQFTVSGRLETTDGFPMSGYQVYVYGTETKSVYTNPDGQYSFTLAAGGQYSIEPQSCEQHPLNGVSTYDMVLIAKHLDGIELLNSPYKIIAADVDGSNSLTTQDTSILRSLILGMIVDIPGGNIRFVRKDYVFPDPFDPFTPPYPKTYSIADLQGDVTNVDFIGVKAGDVNNTAVDIDQCDHQNFNIYGKVFRDDNSDCLLTPGEDGLAGWKVYIFDGQNEYFGTSDASGEYKIAALPGTYDVILFNPGELWGGCPDTLFDVEVTPQGAFGVNFGLQPLLLCPSTSVDLSNAILRRCFENIYQVKYCNTGTATAENARVEITFDPYFEILNSTLPWSAVNGNTYTFPLGDLPSGDCGDFKVVFRLDCDADLGQTHCSEAHIYPDTVCDPQLAWNGAALRVKGQCSGNEVKFTIENQGTDMLAPSNYIVVEDIVVMAPPVHNPFTLQSGSAEVITVPANGATWRLEAEQPSGYPWGTKASAMVEGCGTDSNGDFSKGFVKQFPPDDASPFIDIDCQQNVGAYDPNDKQGFPTGVLAEHYVPLDQTIEYLIRFQNTGTDTAFTVKVRDTLDLDFDMKSLRPLGSSHPYTFELKGQNVAEFVFANILLPDSNVNEAASHGYIKFSIAPQKGLLNGTTVENQAAIFFDYNAPVITNKTLHTLGEKYLDVSNVVFSPGIGLEVYPNPVVESATFLLKSASPVRGTLTVFDLNGRIVRAQNFEHNQFLFNSKNLQAGTYFFRIASENQVLAAGKLAVVKN